MSLETRYDLLAPVPDFGSDRTVPGRERFSGRPVTIHLLGGGSAEANRELLAQADRLPERERSHIFETGTYVGLACAITDALPGGQPFRAWVFGVAGEATIEMPAPAANAPGEFTLFLKGVGQEPTQKSAGADREKSGPAPARPAQTQGPGEFTMFLRGASTEPTEAAPAAAKAPETAAAAPAQIPDAHPGEFTMLLRGAAEPEAPKPSPAPQPERPAAEPEPQRSASPQAPGEFTMFLRGLREGERNASTAAPLDAPVVREPSPKRDYTVPERPARSQPEPVRQSEIETKIFSAPVAPKPVAAPTPTSPASNVEGEFTRFLKGSEPAREAQPTRRDAVRDPLAGASEGSPSPPASAAPGEFTSFLNGSEPARGAEPIGRGAAGDPLAGPSGESPSPPASPAPGEFTRFLTGSEPARDVQPTGRGAADDPLARSSEKGPFPAASSVPGEFTQWLQGPQAGASQPKTPAFPGTGSDRTSGEYTKIISGQRYSESGGGSMFTPPPAPAGNPLSAQSASMPGQDDFERVIGSAPAQRSTGPAAAAPPQTAPLAPADGRRRRLLIIAVIVVVVLLAGLAIAAVLLM